MSNFTSHDIDKETSMARETISLFLKEMIKKMTPYVNDTDQLVDDFTDELYGKLEIVFEVTGKTISNLRNDAERQIEELEETIKELEETIRELELGKDRFESEIRELNFDKDRLDEYIIELRGTIDELQNS